MSEATPKPPTFAAKLDLVLKALSMSRGGLAADLGVDKSVVSRWMTGAVVPSEHNLAHLTRYVAGRRQGFTLLDWQRDIAALARQLGVEAPAGASGTASGVAGRDWLPLPVTPELNAFARTRAGAYEGIWRSTRIAAAAGLKGVFLHDHVLFRASPEGPMTFRLGVFDMRLNGWALPVKGQLFGVASDASGEFMFAIFNGAPGPKAMRMDGLTMMRLRDGGGTPVSAPCLLERVADLTGDEAADDARLEELLAGNPIAPEGSIAGDIAAHLFRDTGPAAMATGGDAMLQMHFARSLALTGE